MPTARYGISPQVPESDSRSTSWFRPSACSPNRHFPTSTRRNPSPETLMHTARWDHAVDLRDARVAVLGTGLTAAQLVPEVAKVAKNVYSVQRSPTWILPKPDRLYT